MERIQVQLLLWNINLHCFNYPPICKKYTGLLEKYPTSEGKEYPCVL